MNKYDKEFLRLVDEDIKRYRDFLKYIGSERRDNPL
jgi:hypothetical protein